ncbi:dual specificity protein phosphatase family protein [Chloroflexota bacterium]
MEVRAILDLREEDTDNPQLLKQYGIRFYHLPMRDLFALSQAQLEEGTRWVMNQLQADRRTLVHCRAGTGRSVFVICSVLMSEGYNLDEALRVVKSKRWGANLSSHQMNSLKEFQQRLLSR